MSEALHLMFDGDCGICQACVRWLDRRDGSKLVVSDPSSQCSWPDAGDLPFADTVIVRDASGATYLRSSAVAKALSVLPGVWGLIGSGVLRVNNVAVFCAVNDHAYRLVSQNRRIISNVLVRLGFLDSSCRVPPSTQN